jgi:hypothetical protein
VHHPKRVPVLRVLRRFVYRRYPPELFGEGEQREPEEIAVLRSEEPESDKDREVIMRKEGSAPSRAMRVWVTLPFHLQNPLSYFSVVHTCPFSFYLPPRAVRHM